MNARIDALQGFHPAVRGWFARALGEPTLPQLEAWPAIMAGKHTLVAAPTGSGKTLAAFFVAINELVQQGLECGSLPDATTVLYVSPLKALGNDIQRNLNVPLEGIAEELQLLGLPPVDIRVAVRSGDTPQQQRQRMVKRPPHILVTTPESLYLLLTSKGGRKLLSTVRSVIVDEIHALLGDKRGAHLSLSLERLQNLLPHPLQRIGLSATQKPIERVAQYLVGNPAGDSDCVIVDSGHRRQLDIKVEVPASPLSALMSNEVWDELYQRLVQLVEAHRTTLVFVNTRRLAERLGLALANRIGAEHVSSHHGSMSKELRFDAEQRLKHGQLKVLVATASMELGIDVGAVELVVQFSSPKRIAAFLQRVGRSGHFVGGLPKGVLFPLTRDDLVECTALIDSIRRGELDRIVIPDKPLDILSQQLVAELGSLEDMGFDASLDELWLWVSRSWSYRNLTHAEFEAIVRMLAEGYSTRRGRSGTLLHHDQINDRVRARKGARLMALTNGGAIPDMFDYQVVLDPEDVVVGSLNEDFALEAIPGDIFSLGNHSWRLLKIDGLKVRVADAQGQPPTLPFWIGEGPGRSRELSEAVSRLRSELHLRFEHSLAAGQQWLQDEVGLDLGAAEQLATYLFTGSRALNVMPTRDCLVMERFFDEVGDMHLVIHAPFGSRVNKAWGLALRKRFCRSFNFELQAAANEDSIVISLGSVHSFELAEVFRYLQSATVRDILVQALLDAPMFEVRWRWNASRALAVQRNRNGKRVPPQFQRMAAEDFVAQVFPDQLACLENISGPREVPQHPLVQQTINDCLSEAMDIDELEEIVRRIESNQVELVARDLREPSPFAQEIINARPYAFLDDAPFEERRTLAIRNRSWIDPAETEDFSALDITAIERVKDEAWPWVRSPDELHEALMLLGFMTEDELQGNATQPDNSVFLEPLLKQGRVTQARHGKHRLWIASERQPQFAALDAAWSFKPAVQLPAALAQLVWSHESALVEILRGRLEGLGPVRASVLAAPLGLSVSQAQQGLLALEMEGFAFQGHYTPLTGAVADTMRTPQGGAQPKAGSVQEKEWCERRLLQRIHRYTIDAHRESIKPVSLQVYMQYLFELHGVQPVGREELLSAATAQTLAQVLQQLDGTTAPATAWEADILPVRLPNYDPAWLDQLCISGHLCWGRILQPREHSGEVRKSGPVKSTPLNLVQRSNLDLWQLLAAQDDSAARPEDVRAGSAGSGVESSARSGAEHDTANSSATHPASTEPAGLSSAATLIYGILQQRGACFFADLARLAGLMAVQVEQALAELVSSGLVTSDNFTGLRALLTPDANKPKLGSHERRRAIYGIEDAGRWSLLAVPGMQGAVQLDDEQLERLLRLYLQRWGVLNRRVLEREQNAPPWRVLLLKLRRMELRGDIRGGRFIAGIGGEQFALAETVDALRRRHKLWQQELERDPTQRSTVRVVLNATDPLNLLGTLLPEKRVPHLSGNRILFEDGVPVAVLEKETARCLQPAKEDRLWDYQQVLQRRYFPPRLRAYLGKV
jgi:ATP-dependent Lhr-like helicase